MKFQKTVVSVIVLACTTIGEASAQVSIQELQQALIEARQATAAAQAAAEKAQNEAIQASVIAQAAADRANKALAELEAKQEGSRASSSPIPWLSTPGNAQATQPGLEGFAITGIADLGVRKTTVSNDSSKKYVGLTNNNASTSLIYFEGQRTFNENLKGSFLLELDFNPTQSSSANGPAASNAYQNTPFGGEQWVAFTGKFGDIKLGTPNSASLAAGLTAQPFGTGIGGAYSPTFGRFGNTAVSGISQYVGNTTGRIIRHERTIMYTTPVFEGFSASSEYSFGNSNSTTVTSNSNGYRSYSLRYNKGSANVIYSYAREHAGAKAAAGTDPTLGTTTTSPLPVSSNIVWNFLAANYKLGSATVYGGYSTTKQNSTPSIEDSKAWNAAIKYELSSTWALMANYLERRTKLRATTPDADFVGLGVNYYIDKSANLYLRNENVKYSSIKTKSSYTTNIAAAGVQYRF